MAVKAAVQPYSLSYTDIRVQILVIKENVKLFL